MKSAKPLLVLVFACLVSALWGQDSANSAPPPPSAGDASAAAIPTATVPAASPASPPPDSDAQPAGKTRGLQEIMDIALSKSNNYAILQKNLEISQAQYKQLEATNAFSLTASLGDTAYDGFGNTSLLSAYSSVSPYSVASTAAGYNTAATYLAELEQYEGKGNGVPNYPFPSMSGNIIPQAMSGGLTFKGPWTTLTLIGNEYLTADSTFGVNQSVLGASLSQTVWDGYPGGIPKANVDKGFLSFQSTQLSSEASRLSLLLQVKQAYYTMLNAQRTMENYRQNLARQKSALDQEQVLFNLQHASAVDLQTAKINYQSAQIDQENGQITLDVDRRTLANLVGIPEDESFVLAEADDPQIPTGSLEDAIKTGLEKRVELKEVVLNRRAGEISLGLAKAQTSPTVSLSAGGYLYLNNTAGTNAQAVNLGVKIGMPIFDSGSAEYQAEASRYQNEVYDVQDKQYRLSITLDIESAYKQVQLQQKKYELAQLTAKNSVDQYELLKVENQYGTATNQDVLTATVTMVNNETAAFTARNSLDLAILQLQNVMGM